MRKNLLLEQKKYIIKSNALIEARYKLSLQESKIILWLLTQIQSEDEDFKPHKLDITEFARLTEVDSGNRYSELRKVTRQLMQRVMEIHSFEQHKVIQVAWLSSAEYEYKKGFVNLEFSPKLRPYLLQLKSHFTKIDIVDTLKLKSIYAVRVFELLLQYVAIGKRKITIFDLRAYCSVQIEEYKNYFDIKRYIIEKAKSEINAKTDYIVDYTQIKESRKVVAIEWTIRKKDNKKKNQSKELDIIQKELRSQNAIIENLSEYGFTKMAAKRLVMLHGEETVKNAIQAVNIQIEKKHAKNPKAMLQTAIIEKWHPEVFRTNSLKN